MRRAQILRGRQRSPPSRRTLTAIVEKMISRRSRPTAGSTWRSITRQRRATHLPWRSGPHDVRLMLLKSTFAHFSVHVRRNSRAMPTRGRGAIVNMSSTAGLQGVAGLAAYSAGKHAVVGMSKAAALDYAGKNIRINIVAPGPSDRTHRQRHSASASAHSSPSSASAIRPKSPQLVRWLCSEESQFITGTSFRSDGGRLPVRHPLRFVKWSPCCTCTLLPTTAGYVGMIATNVYASVLVQSRDTLIVRTGLTAWRNLLARRATARAGRPHWILLSREFARPAEQRLVDCHLRACRHRIGIPGRG